MHVAATVKTIREYKNKCRLQQLDHTVAHNPRRGNPVLPFDVMKPHLIGRDPKLRRLDRQSMRQLAWSLRESLLLHWQPEQKITNWANGIDLHSLARVHELDEPVAAIGRESDFEGSLKALVEVEPNHVVIGRYTSGNAIPRQESVWGWNDSAVSHFETTTCDYEKPCWLRAESEGLGARSGDGECDCQYSHDDRQAYEQLELRRGTETHKNGSTHLSLVDGPDNQDKPHNTEYQPKNVEWRSVLKIESETPKDVEGPPETARGYEHDQQTQTRIAGLNSFSATPVESRQQKANQHYAASAEDQNKSHVICVVVRASRASFQEYSVLMGVGVALSQLENVSLAPIQSEQGNTE
jgi:hypothetical protein